MMRKLLVKGLIALVGLAGLLGIAAAGGAGQAPPGGHVHGGERHVPRARRHVLEAHPNARHMPSLLTRRRRLRKELTEELALRRHLLEIGDRLGAASASATSDIFPLLAERLASVVPIKSLTGRTPPA